MSACLDDWLCKCYIVGCADVWGTVERLSCAQRQGVLSRQAGRISYPGRSAPRTRAPEAMASARLDGRRDSGNLMGGT